MLDIIFYRYKLNIIPNTYIFGHVMFAEVQVPNPYNSYYAIARPHCDVGVIDVFFFRPHDDGYVKSDAVHVDDNAEHAIEHAQ